ncbi:hypothetical protein [Siphonobacter sp. BAB-5405]|uniref:hypothetical protein n=1 Tax=Siphonobacter sp. BAB-5405 TaxID=1864825 RepID=UPI0011AF87B5|nr:hypothetical protein [Siphonobacter sp. BAB-5405]
MRCFTFLSILCLCIGWNPVIAQDSTRSFGTYFVQAATTALSSSDRTAFWLQTNQYGTIPTTPQGGLLSAGVYYRIPLSRRANRWSIDAGLEGIAQTQNPN